MSNSILSIRTIKSVSSPRLGNSSSLFGNLIPNPHRLLRPPAQTDPLADIVGQTSPQGLYPNLNQTAQTKLAQAKFLFDPSIGKLRNLRPLLINFTSRLAGHLLPMSPHFRGLRTSERLWLWGQHFPFAGQLWQSANLARYR